MQKAEIGIRTNDIPQVITAAFFVLYALRSAWLAFDKEMYSSWFTVVSLWTARLCVPLGIIYLCRQRKVESSFLALVFLPLIYYLMQVMHSYQGYAGGEELRLITLVIFVLFSKEMKAKIFHFFYWVVQIQNIIAILVWVAYFLNINIGFRREYFYSDNSVERLIYYYRWTIFAIYNSGITYRLCGIFNEPGGLGTLCALLFICTAQKTKLWEKLILLSAGALTLSLAFYLLIFAYITVYVWGKNPKNIFFIVPVVILFLMIPQIDFHNEALNALAARFAIVDGRLAGDNRITAVFDARYAKFLKTNKKWFGMGYGFSFGGGNSSYKSHYIVPFGILGTAFLLGTWFVAAWHYAEKKKVALLYAAFFFISLYQRPSAIFNCWGYVALLGGIEWQRLYFQPDKEVEVDD